MLQGRRILWVDYFKKYRHIKFDNEPPKPKLCSLVDKYKNNLNGAVLFNSDGFSTGTEGGVNLDTKNLVNGREINFINVKGSDISKNIKIVTNAGGLNPSSMANEIEKILKEKR